jgi:L-seryl-tRNA(Ser) seleniumtransferase
MSSQPVGRHRPPSVEQVLAAIRAAFAVERSHDALVQAVRALLADERDRLAGGAEARSVEALSIEALNQLDRWVRPGIRPLINATGVILHTNLGRAPWPAAAIAAAAAADGYLQLELDPLTGRRGQRFRLAEEHLIALSGAEDALVTNNNAAALALACALVGSGGIVVSRGELVEIGGGVRIPEIVRRAGATLIEVGTTNRTRAGDYEAPLAAGEARAVLRVHASNFSMAGFVDSPDPIEVATIAHRHDAFVVDDLGSGALLATERFGLAHEPLPAERLAAGSDVVTFSGDKLVGGPQAGLVVGRADLIGRMRRDPLARAMRPDKATLLGVAATLGLYRAGLAEAEIPVWQMIGAPLDRLRDRAAALTRPIGDRAMVADLRSVVGGGSLPVETLPSAGIALQSTSADALLAALRDDGTTVVIGRIEDDRVVLDLRTVHPEQDEALAEAIEPALAAWS